ncbi:hypothetical protein F4778DRAFT_526446 [Xylariomycetidae sp. FL2044]|nr:hypothetical protein F4778DRAFT_526446 [Xylariomycetidae sp. FL2044]
MKCRYLLVAGVAGCVLAHPFPPGVTGARRDVAWDASCGCPVTTTASTPPAAATAPPVTVSNPPLSVSSPPTSTANPPVHASSPTASTANPPATVPNPGTNGVETTTISISDVGFTTITVSAGEETVIPLPAGHLTTVSGPIATFQTVFTLPDGQPTTLSVAPGASTVVSLPGAGLSTVLPAPPATIGTTAPIETTVVILPSGQLTTVSLQSDLPTVVSLSGIGQTTIQPTLPDTAPPVETTTIVLPGGQVTTLSVFLGQPTVVSLRGVGLTTITATPIPAASTGATFIPLPSGQQTTVPYTLGIPATISLPGVGVTTVSFSAPPVLSNNPPALSSPPPKPLISSVTTGTTVIPLPAGQQTTVLLTLSVPVTLTLPGVGVTTVSLNPPSVPPNPPVATSPTVSMSPPTANPNSATESTTASTTSSPSSPSAANPTTAPTSRTRTTSAPGGTQRTTPSVSQTIGTTSTTSVAPSFTVQANTLLPVSTVRVYFDGTSFLVPPCGAQPAGILLSNGLMDCTLFCDRLVVHGITFMLPADVSDSPKETMGGWTVQWTPRNLRSKLPVENIRRILGKVAPEDSEDSNSSSSGGTGGIGGWLGQLFGVLGSHFTQVALDAAGGLVEMGGEYELQNLNKIKSTVDDVMGRFGTLGEDIPSVIETLRSTPNINLDPLDIHTINELGSGLAQAENFCRQLHDLADVTGVTDLGHALIRAASDHRAVLRLCGGLTAGIWGANYAIRHGVRLRNIVRPDWSPDTDEARRPEQEDISLHFIECRKGTTVAEFNLLKEMIGAQPEGYSIGINAWTPEIGPSYFVLVKQSEVEILNYLPMVDFILKHPTHADTLDPTYNQGPVIYHADSTGIKASGEELGKSNK